MAGGTDTHNTISGNIAGELRNAAISTGRCYPFSSEVKIEIEPGGKYVYPDAGLACPDRILSKQLVGAITNPRVVVEVVSESSFRYDWEQKRRDYFSLPSVQEYLLISQDEAVVTVLRRRGDLMRIDTYEGLAEAVLVEALGVSIAMAEIYRFVELA